MKTTITGQINYKARTYSGEPEFFFHMGNMSEYGYTEVIPLTIEFELPANFDPRTEQVKALQAEKIRLMADFQKRCTQIERKISELTALTFEVPS